MNDTETPNPVAPAFQYVAVPVEFVPAVYRLIAELSEAEVPTVTSASSDADTGSSAAFWNDERLTRFARGENKTTQMVSEIMDILADRDENDPASIDELAEITGHPRTQLKTLWTHMARHLKKRYETNHWPLHGVWGTDLTPPRPAIVFYYLTADQAEQWKRIRSAS